MTMLRLALVALVFASAFCNVVLAQGTEICNSTRQCIQINGNCANTGLPAGTTRVCVQGSLCVASAGSSICQRQPRLGEACDATGSLSCFNDDYSGVACLGGRCKYTNIYFPGESCRDEADFNNGGCVLGSCVSGKCTTISSSGNCSTSPNLCAPGFYCTDNGACTSRLGAGITCTSSLQCQSTFVCTSRGGTAFTCQALFAQAVTQGCDSDFDCNADLYCGSTRKCVAPVNPPSGDCSEDGPTNCGSNAFCVCDAKTNDDESVDRGTAKCVSASGNDNSYINQVKSYQKCAADRGCQDLWYFEEVLSSTVPLTGPSQCANDCKHNLIYDYDGEEGKCFSAAVGLMPAVLLSALVACFALFL